MQITRGEIWQIKLDPTVGSEIKKLRPCVIVSPNELNQYLSTVIVAPMTTKARPAQFRTYITHDGKRGLVMLDQIRVVDKSRLTKKLGKASPKALNESLDILQEIFST
jgi:mRNA interferase MazF